MAGSSVAAPCPSRRRRFAAMMYESVLLFGVVTFTLLIFDVLSNSQHALYLRHGRQLILFLSIGLYFMLCWRRSGQTLPMKTWCMRLEAKDGTKPSYARLLLRYVAMWLLPLLGMLGVWGLQQYTGYRSTTVFFVFTPFTIFIWTWFDKDGYFLHDRLAGTRLVDLQQRHLQNKSSDI